MAKYSVNSSQSDDEESCQICGEEDGKLTTAKMEGTILTVCKDCEPASEHREDVTPEESNNTTTSSDNKPVEQKIAENKPKHSDPYTNPDWIDEVEYGNARTPYLVSDYDEKLQNVLDTKELTKSDINDEIGVPTESVQSLLDHNATQDNVGRKEIEAIEAMLDIELIDQV